MPLLCVVWLISQKATDFRNRVNVGLCQISTEKLLFKECLNTSHFISFIPVHIGKNNKLWVLGKLKW